MAKQVVWCEGPLLPKAASELGIFSVSFGEISWFLRGNSQTPDLTAAIGGNLAKADPENAFTSGSYRPEGDPRARIN